MATDHGGWRAAQAQRPVTERPGVVAAPAIGRTSDREPAGVGIPDADLLELVPAGHRDRLKRRRSDGAVAKLPQIAIPPAVYDPIRANPAGVGVRAGSRNPGQGHTEVKRIRKILVGPAIAQTKLGTPAHAPARCCDATGELDPSAQALPVMRSCHGDRDRTADVGTISKLPEGIVAPAIGIIGGGPCADVKAPRDDLRDTESAADRTGC